MYKSARPGRALLLLSLVAFAAGCTSGRNMRVLTGPDGRLTIAGSPATSSQRDAVCHALRHHVLDFDERGHVSFPERDLGCADHESSSCASRAGALDQLKCRVEEIRQEMLTPSHGPAYGHVMLIVHGGLVPRETGLNEAVAASSAIENDCDSGSQPCHRYFPIFVIWRSGALDTYADHTFAIDQGERRPIFSTFVSGLTAGTDLARGAARTVRFGAGESLRLWNSIAKPWYLGSEDPKTLCKNLADLPVERDDSRSRASRGLFSADRTVCPTVTESSQGWVISGAQRATYLSSIPIRMVTTPVLLGPGQSAWENMRRRAHTLIWREAEREPSIGKHDEALPMLKGGLQYTAEKLLVDLGDRKLTLIGHSMGAIVLTELLAVFPDLKFDNAVFMGAAVSLRAFVYALRNARAFRSGNARFYNLSLHPRNEAFELSGYGLLPSGSLLEWIDEAYHSPPTQLDRTLGKWINLPALHNMVDEDIAARTTFRMFGFEAGEPQSHGEFNDVEMCYWRPSFWADPDWKAHRDGCESLLKSSALAPR